VEAAKGTPAPEARNPGVDPHPVAGVVSADALVSFVEERSRRFQPACSDRYPAATDLGVGLRCGDTTLGNRTDQRGVVVGVRVGVSVSELGDGVVEEVAVAEVRRYRKPVS
jgi:hypothetical protein